MGYFITVIIAFVVFAFIFSMSFIKTILSFVVLWIYSFLITPSLSYQSEDGVYDSDILLRYKGAISDDGVWETFAWTATLYMILIFFIGVFSKTPFSENLKNKTPYIQATIWAVFIEFILRYNAVLYS